MSDDKLELQFKLLDYHHRAMESRRSIQFRIFLVLAGLILLLARGMLDTKLTPLKDSHEWLAALVFFGLALCFSGFTWAVEGWNKHDCDRYVQLEDKIWKSLELGDVPDNTQDLLGVPGKVSWAGWWPVLSIWLLAIVCWVFVKQ